jgi:hypothetical protein
VRLSFGIASLAVVVATALTAASPTAHAQRRWPGASTRDPGAVAEAREIFGAGLTAAEDERWADAVAAFERSYALSGEGIALFNLASALRSLGRHRDARDAFDQLLEQHPDIGAQRLETARAWRQQSADRVATLRLTRLPETTVLVTVDGAAVPDGGARPLAVEVDGGREHAIRVELEGHLPFEWNGLVSEGVSRDVPVRLVAQPSQVVVAGTADRRAEPAPVPVEEPSPVEWPVFWIVVGAVVVAAVGAVLLGFALAEDDIVIQPMSPNVLEL